jgi:CheY-like chemotaxis protein
MSGATVFVVEDDEEILLALGEVMEMEGLTPRLFTNAEDALDALAFGSQPPSLFVIDLQMRRMSGAALIELLRDTPPWSEIPIVVFTGSVDFAVPSRHGVPVIEKPNIEALVAAVATLRDQGSWQGDDQRSAASLATFRPIHESLALSADGPE